MLESKTPTTVYLGSRAGRASRSRPCSRPRASSSPRSGAGILFFFLVQMVLLCLCFLSCGGNHSGFGDFEQLSRWDWSRRPSWRGPQVIDGLIQVLWAILYWERPETQTINSIIMLTVELIYGYAECYLALHGNQTGSVAPAVALLKKFR
ncbi:hypothetical protein ZIOFF_070625 [Zingiber officinale]|uniref:Uncharacterized protein n=1 Tax=Zingiber officinale TaxID=94328 RepID=A0A8J5EN57_ZINOF|nr:hypothetical protein ZIOFF_070625 [Zingiber officinale]